jgi:hypothetical protein
MHARPSHHPRGELNVSIPSKNTFTSNESGAQRITAGSDLGIFALRWRYFGSTYGPHCKYDGCVHPSITVSMLRV